MKLWKSPVLYLGIVLVLAVSAALAAPHVVDWGQYRASIEAYGRKLTGRDVKVEGPIAVRLFPWPKLVVDGVRIANPAGAKDDALLTAERVDVRVTLAGLFNGEIQVESIEVIRPVLSVERMAAGAWTWAIQPSEDIARSRLLEHVKLDQVTLTDGTLRLTDGKRGGSAELSNVNATLSAPGVLGPWRLQGSGTYGRRPLSIAMTTGTWQDGAPLKFGVRVSPGEGAGLTYDFDGEHKAGRIAGELRIAQAATPEGKSDAEGAFRPLVLIAKVESQFDEVDFKEIAIAPRDDEKTGNLLSGDARISLGAVIGVDANLTASKFNLDQVAGAKAKALLRGGDGLTLLADLLDALPDGIDGRGTLKVTSLIAGGEKLQNVTLSAAVTEDALHIHELSAGLPGQTQALFKGGFIVSSRGPQLAGEFAAESLDLRALAGWALPGMKDALLKSWSGSRGRFKLETQIDATPDRLRLLDAAYQLDDAVGSASFSLVAGPRPAANLAIEASLIDIDSFVPGGIAALSPGEGASFADALAATTVLQSSADIGVTLKVGRLLLNGVEARDAVIDGVSSQRGLDLRTVSIGDVGGARLGVSGLVSQGASGMSGSVAADVAAKSPHGLLKLLGFARGAERPVWFEPLGETDLKIAAEFSPDGGKTQGSFDVSGTSGKLHFSGNATLSDLDWRTATIDGSAAVKSDLSAALLQVLGLKPVLASESPGVFAVTAAGSLATGLDTKVEAVLYGASLRFDGNAERSGDAIKAKGRVGISAERSGPMFRALGVAVDEDLLFSAEADAAYDGGAMALAQLSGLVAGAPFSGVIDIASDGRVTGTLDVPRIDLARLLGQAYMPWNGKVPEVEAPFAESLPLGLEGEVWINPRTLEVFDGFEIEGAALGIVAQGRDIQMNVHGLKGDGDSFHLELTGKAAPGGRQFKGQVTLPVDLASRLKTADGAPAASGLLVIDGKFEGFGRSPASVLSALDGSGTYRLESASLSRFAPASFATRIADAKSPEDIDGALSALTAGGAFGIADTNGSFTLQDGIAAFLPMRLKGDTADAIIKPVAEVATGLIDIGIDLQFKEPPGVPAMEVAYAGPPLALSRSVDAAALQARLGMDVLQRGVDELERLQEEERRLAIEEDKARAEDKARLDAYEAKRRELRQRQREIAVHRRMREEAERQPKEEAKKEEVKPPEAEAKPVEAEPITVRPKARPKRAKPPRSKPEEPIGPVVIVPPQLPPARPPPQKTRPRTVMDLLNDL